MIKKRHKDDFKKFLKKVSDYDDYVLYEKVNKCFDSDNEFDKQKSDTSNDDSDKSKKS